MNKVKCQFCEKLIEGYSEKQVQHLLNQHIMSKHPEKISIKIDKK